MHSVIVGLLLVGSAVGEPILANRNTVMTARCRAQCLNKFVIDAPTKDCSDDFFCGSCWSLCDKLYRNVDEETWRRECDNNPACTTGCQESCRFYSSHSELIEATRTDTHFTQPLKYEVDDRHDVVHFSWTVPEGNDRIEPLVYVLAAYDQTSEESLDQTYFHNLTVSKDLLRLFSHIRLTAYDSNGKVAEMEMSLLDFKLEQWSPSLNSLKFCRRPIELDVDAHISWPRLTDEDVTYELEWKPVDNSLDITGYITTQNNAAVVSLWPNSLYRVRIRALRTESPNVVAQSKTIFFYTNPDPGNGVSEWKCGRSNLKSHLEDLCLVVIVGCSLLLTVIIITRRKQNSSDSQCVLEGVCVGSEKSPSISKPNSVWHVGPLPGYKIFQNDESFTWTPPELHNHPKGTRM